MEDDTIMGLSFLIVIWLVVGILWTILITVAPEDEKTYPYTYIDYQGYSHTADYCKKFKGSLICYEDDKVVNVQSYEHN